MYTIGEERLVQLETSNGRRIQRTHIGLRIANVPDAFPRRNAAPAVANAVSAGI
jgi:hypothetical protein